LGIDTIPLKTCNWNCVYCQLGRTRPVTNTRKAYYPREEILDEIRQALAQHRPGAIDWVTFVGSGEPTLHSEIGWLIRQAKRLTDLPVAVITNGALLYQQKVRRELFAADAVLPSVDAGSPDLYRRLNRPHPEVTFTRFVAGLVSFSSEYQGKLWPEVMLIWGLNDGEEALRAIAAILQRLHPDEIHISLPTRPPAETWVKPADKEGVLRAQAILGDVARVLHPAQGIFELRADQDITTAIVNIVTRHPMSEEDLLHTLRRWSADDVQTALDKLKTSGHIQVIYRYGHPFWCSASAYYPAEAKSRATDPRHHERPQTSA
jgi:wyosine [tRNA(Phe)-imidazoG37] synthetase (radical SAM superfamily)